MEYLSYISVIKIWVLDLAILDLDLAILDLDLDLGSDPGSSPNWPSDRPLRILTLRYTGFKGHWVASNGPRLTGPRIG